MQPKSNPVSTMLFQQKLPIAKSFPHFYLAALLTTTGFLLTSSDSFAQFNLPNCQAPQPNEYLLLVLTTNTDTQEKVRRAFPDVQKTTVCRYGNDVVTRIGGFNRLDFADSWADYIRDNLGLRAVVAQPSQTRSNQTVPSSTSSVVTQQPPTLPNNSAPTTRPTIASNTDYNPQPLSSGYAVLVDYLNNPNIAYQLRGILGRNVGLAVYFSRPYVLISYTENATEANSTARNLSNRGFAAVVVDSSKVTVLTPAVK